MWPLQLPRAVCSLEVALPHCHMCALHCHIRPASKLHLLMWKNDLYKLFPYVHFTKLLHVLTLVKIFLYDCHKLQKEKKKVLITLRA